MADPSPERRRTIRWKRSARRGVFGVLCLSAALVPGAAGCRRHAVPGSASAPRAAASALKPGLIPSTYGVRPAEREAIEDFLRRHGDLRLATESDRRVSPSGDGDVRRLYGVYNPYFVRGDVNDDGILDFVIAFVRRDSAPSTPWFTVAVFTGKDAPSGGPGFGRETFLERDITLAAGDLSIDRDAVVITPDLEDETTRRYRWDPARRSYVFVRDGAADVESPAVSRT